jgi:hypothetical protein
MTALWIGCAQPPYFVRALPRAGLRTRASVDCKRNIVSRSTRRARRPRGLAALNGVATLIRGGAGIFSNEKAGTVIPLFVEPEHPLETSIPAFFF